MSESENTETTEQETKLDIHHRKRFRHRKKLLYDKILKQMEFYFSNANLTKDRVLGGMVKSNPYVQLDFFLKCNKIRALTQDVLDIVKATKHSTLLELSEDKTKVKRKTPLEPYDADARTVYVESIPVNASREWLERVFSEYGPIAYISLPRFKISQKIKGFAFIEFENPEDSQNCVAAFTKMGCKLPTCMPPEELCSIKLFAVEDLDKAQDKEVQCEKVDEEPPRKKMKKNKDKKPKLELKAEPESDSDRTVDTPTTENKSTVTSIEETIPNDCTKKESSQDEGKKETEEDTTRKKKSRKRNKDKKRIKLDTTESPKAALWGLQILPKSEWKRLRNKYLNLQRKYMKEMKFTLKNHNHYAGIPAPAAASAEIGPAVKPGEEKSSLTLEKIPGVFVEETLPEPCLDVRLTKRTIRSNVHALHVDAKEGKSEVIIRFDTPEAANEYCTASTIRARVLSAAEETEQWSRAEAARSNRRPRGRDRILAKHETIVQSAALSPTLPQPTHTHIRFDEE